MKASAGNATINFTDALLPVEGFKGIHDLPKVSVLFLEESGEKFALASVEIVMLWDDFIERLRQRISDELSVPFDNVWIHVTHAITTPHAPGGPMLGLGGDAVELSEEDKARRAGELEKRKLYEDAISHALDNALNQCENAVEAMVYVGAGQCNLIQGRDIKTPEGWWIGINGDGESNQTMTILSFKDLNGDFIANVMSYGMKPCVIDNAEMDKESRLISADAPGLCARSLEEEFSCPLLYLTAAAGDRVPIKTAWYDTVENGRIKTVDLGVERGLEFAKELSSDMTKAAGQIIREAKEIVADRLLIKTTDFNWKTKGRIPMHPYKELSFEAEGETKVPVAVLSIGNVALVASKPEINTVTELQLKASIKQAHTLYVSMVNGGMKYMPDIKSYDELRWEALTSMLMPGAAERLVDVAKGLLE